MNDKAKIRNKFVSPYPTDPVKIVSLNIRFAENSVF